MVLGYCMSCEKLCPIKQGPQKLGSRECAWFPREHDDPKTGRQCPGIKREIK